MEFVSHDGRRVAAGYKGKTGDCVTRSIAIATGKTYGEVYDALNQLAQTERTGKCKRRRSSSRTGVYRRAYQTYLESLGWRWTATMTVGSGWKPEGALRRSHFDTGCVTLKGREQAVHPLRQTRISISRQLFDQRPN